ncbi:MAG: hypothetical protein H0S79_24800 [Anaerolineaceae bacterium]|nr:hypothetical protein [Anaerolineaceae bacterium]
MINDEAKRRDDHDKKRTDEFKMDDGVRSLALLGDYIWVAGRNHSYQSENKPSEIAGKIQKIDRKSRIALLEINLPSYPMTLLSDDQFIWTALENGDLIKLDPETGIILLTITSEKSPRMSQPYAVSMTWDGNTISALYLQTQAWGYIAQINPENGNIERKFSIQNSYPKALTWDGKNLWAICSGDDELLKFDPKSSEATKAIRVGYYPRYILWDGNYIWVAGGYHQGDLVKVDIEKNNVETRIEFEHLSRAIALDGTHIWLACDNGVIHKVDRQSGQITVTITKQETFRKLLWDGEKMWGVGSNKTEDEIDLVEIQFPEKPKKKRSWLFG